MCHGEKAQKVFSGAGFSQQLISDRAWLLKKVYLVKSLYLQTCCLGSDNTSPLEHRTACLPSYIWHSHSWWGQTSTEHLPLVSASRWLSWFPSIWRTLSCPCQIFWDTFDNWHGPPAPRAQVTKEEGGSSRSWRWTTVTRGWCWWGRPWSSDERLQQWTQYISISRIHRCCSCIDIDDGN